MASNAAHFPDSLAPKVEASGPNAVSPTLLYPVQSSGRPEQMPTDAGSVPEGSDEQLLEQIRDGAKEALSTLFRRHARTVHFVAQRILRDPAEAEDLVQEVFLFVFSRAALFDPAKGSARSWLVQVTYHRAFDRRRYLASRHHRSNLEIGEAILGAGEPVALTMPYENTLEGALGGDALRRIEESLSDMQRRVLYLHFYEGHTVNEIAAIVGQSVANVRNHYYRALEKIRREVFNPPMRGK